ncbi:MAG: hypothetical protein ACREMW_05775 [Gemmatimonadales bacterium]
MQDALTIYFHGEKNAGLVLTGLGLLGLAAAAPFFQPRWGLRSFAVTLAVFALIEIAIGVGLHLRTGPQVSSLLALLGSDATRFVAEEGARMARVQRNFLVVQYIEAVVIVVATITAVALKHRVAIAGIALGLVLNATLLLAFDLVAERRGAAYLTAIEAQAKQP